jgi:hypothetical protein
VVWPLVLVLLSAPLAVFYAKIGTDELDYSRIAGRLGSPDSLVESLPASTWRAKFGQGLGEAELRQQVEARLRQQRDDLLRLCDEFLARHPRSGRFAAVLWVKVQGLSLQFDAGGLKYSAGFPPAESEPAWRELSSRGQGSPQAALADARVAELTLRRAFSPRTPDEESRGLVREAYERLAAAAWLRSRTSLIQLRRQPRKARCRICRCARRQVQAHFLAISVGQVLTIGQARPK